VAVAGDAGDVDDGDDVGDWAKTPAVEINAVARTIV
jgi:hypothetical protein